MSFRAKLSFNDKVVRTIYSVQETEYGVLQFLVFDEYTNKWAWKSASEYVPLEENK